MKTHTLNRNEMEVVIAELESSLKNLEAKFQLLRQCVDTDELTQLLRRGAFMTKLGNLLSSSKKQNRNVHVMMIDVDHFKKVNDTYGHQTGDVVLEQVAALVRNYLRPQDLAGRYGGEEIIVAVEADAQDVEVLAEKIRSALEAHKMISKDDHKSFQVTLSMGIASSQKHGYEADTLIGKADSALYRAKHNGRNQVQVAQEHSAITIEKIAA